MSQKGRKKNAKADDKKKPVYFSWSDDEVQLLLNVAINLYNYKNIEDNGLNDRILPQIYLFCFKIVQLIKCSIENDEL